MIKSHNAVSSVFVVMIVILAVRDAVSRVVVEVFGELNLGMEGGRLDVDSWRISPVGCTAVADSPHTWGGVKAMYR